MPKIIDGRMVAHVMQTSLVPKIAAYSAYSSSIGEGVPPTLAIICHGENEASKKYIQKKVKVGAELGMRILLFSFEENVHIDEPISTIECLNSCPTVHGIMVQHPIPQRYLMLEQELVNHIKPEKDVDGLTSMSQGLLMTERPHFQPSTAKGIMTILERHVSISGKWVSVIGASNVIGKPLSMLLTNMGASVSLFQKSSRDEDIMSGCKHSDIIISCCGVPHRITPDYIREGVVLIDAGYSNGVGDIHPDCYQLSEYYTPVPGGVGPVTVASILTQTVDAALASINKSIPENKR
jgi:methylenetetrahydrofolate dehydrogenase (NADP+)/methenyltetrahydrofolate cyclohydrolase